MHPPFTWWDARGDRSRKALLVACSTLMLALDRDRDTRAWRVPRLDAVVHSFFLRPLLDLHGWDLVADRFLHAVVPVLAVGGWLVLGPRGRTAKVSLAAPVAWLGYTLVRGAFVSWYPYPFIDRRRVRVRRHPAHLRGRRGAHLASAWGALLLDRRLSPAAEGADRLSLATVWAKVRA